MEPIHTYRTWTSWSCSVVAATHTHTHTSTPSHVYAYLHMYIKCNTHTHNVICTHIQNLDKLKLLTRGYHVHTHTHTHTHTHVCIYTHIHTLQYIHVQYNVYTHAEPGQAGVVPASLLCAELRCFSLPLLLPVGSASCACAADSVCARVYTCMYMSIIHM